ncbi:sensor histidine kinase [Allosalinactinospora lopnorensis]|uniref:sensor histidine kinase n=1 Tax=Allosalinactinospora lopnorensis TaxID=1352348 RepID=UPI000623EB6A|nr:sensor histidine kinase [Allosalinactinospora lopnorensis]
MSQGPPESGRDWEQWWGVLLIALPWLLLPSATILSLVQPGQTWADRSITLSLAGLAAGWILAGHTLASEERRERQAPMRVYFAGLLVLFVVLMWHDLLFLLFAITGFFHAALLKPWPWTMAGVGGSSVALNTMTMGFPGTDPGTPFVQHISVYVGVIAIQTLAISSGYVFGEKASEQHEQRKLTVAKLEAALEENAGLHAQLLSQAREAGMLDERQRMAREIHDTLAQGLTGIVTQVQAAQRVWHSPDQARPHLDRTLALARDSLAEARRSVQALRPRELAEAHLPDALSDMAHRWAKGRDIDLRVDVTGDRLPLSSAIEVALFRTAQEALTNVAKHAEASRVGLTLSYLDDAVLLDVRDDGRGMTGAGGQGVGLDSMRQRIRSAGGAMEIETAPGEGTAVSVSVPAVTVEAP